MKKRRLEKVLAIIAVLTLIVAGLLGFRKEAGEVKNNVASILPASCYSEKSDEMQFKVFDKESDILVGYISIEQSNGYGGKMDVAILVDTSAHITDIEVIKHRETPSFLKKVEKKGLIKSLIGKKHSDSFSDGEDIVIVSGATYTSDALINSSRKGVRKIASNEMNLPVPDDEPVHFSIDIPEIALILLYVIAFFGIYSGFKYKNQLRWITMTGGLIILGFWFAVPLSLAKINSFLLGFWPSWHTELYWYILIFGFVITLIATGKNIYCTWICPVGCIQESLGVIGAAKPRFSKKINNVMKWISRTIAWLAIAMALYFRNPVKINYEIFGVSTSLTGATYLFAMTGIFFIASLFIKRPWCRYLCPITPISDFLQLFKPKKNSK
ncbi:MAG: 4Fe-4S binding protein [Bacteroidales bacterium]|nr:4Fe-4S binding protein [Bacteroidales bacterium]